MDSTQLKINPARHGACLQSNQAFVHIEEVQDMVQEELMKSGHFKIAEAYILYRAQRQIGRGAPNHKSPPSKTLLALSKSSV